MKLFERKLHARIATKKQESINSKVVPQSSFAKELLHSLLILLIARKWTKSEANMRLKPRVIIFKLNSVHLERASSATLARKLEYASICLLSEGILSLPSSLDNKPFLMWDQLSIASSYKLRV